MTRSPASAQEAWLSPLATRKSPAPEAVKLSESDDEISPTSSVEGFLSPSRFHFSSPEANKLLEYGGLSEDRSQRPACKIAAVTFLALLWCCGCFSWVSLVQSSLDPVLVVPPLTSPSGIARSAFEKIYKRDWGAQPSLWVVLEAANSKRPTHNNRGELDSHSFADDTSVVYEQGKHFIYDLSYELEDRFRNNGASSVKITSYYSLQEQGLDYMARNLVTPDGSKTLVQIQYIKVELGDTAEMKLKQFILEFGQQNQPQNLNIHYTGQTWHGSLRMARSKVLLMSGSLVLLLLAFLLGPLGAQGPVTRWDSLILVSLATSLSAGSTVFRVVTSTSSPLALSSMLMITLFLTVYYSKVQLDCSINSNTDVTWVIYRSGGVLIASFGSLSAVSSPTLQTVGAANTVAVASCVIFHAILLPSLLKANGTWLRLSKRTLLHESPPTTSLTSRPCSYVLFCITTTALLLAACRAPVALKRISLDGSSRSGFLSGDSSNPFHAMGETVGYGRLTPIRILFDGVQKNQSVVTLAGYDIQQMVLEELIGISLDGSEVKPSHPGQEMGATHIGEEYAEVQLLIKELVSTLRQFKEEQQRLFDVYHQRREELWAHRQMKEESDADDTRCEYPVNSGISSTTYTGIAMLENLRIPQSLYSAANICRGMEPRCPSEALNLLNVIEDETTPPHRLATYVIATLGVDPFSKAGIQWLRLARETIERLQADPRVLGGVKVYIDGGQAAAMYDYDAHQAELLPKQLLIVGLVTAVALCIALRSLLLPLKIVATTLLTMVATIGAFSMVHDEPFVWTDQYPSVSGFSVVLLCTLCCTSKLVSVIARDEQDRSNGISSSLIVSTKLLSAFMVLLSLAISMSAKKPIVWPLLVVTALCLEMLWVPPTKVKTEQATGHGTTSIQDGCRLASGQGTYEAKDDLGKKFEMFLLSPGAP
jgi:MMPL family